MTVTVREIEDYTNIAEFIYVDQIDPNITNDLAEVTQAGCLKVFNEFSPNDDGANYPHQLVLNRKGDRLSLGLKPGVGFFSLDFSKGLRRDDNDVQFNENIKGKLLPTVDSVSFTLLTKRTLDFPCPIFFPRNIMIVISN